MIRKFSRQILALVLLSPLAFVAQAQPALYTAGTHYDVLSNPVRTVDPQRVEVTEVFWYGCGHCFSFQPLVENWVENKPEDVDFVHFPAIWNDLMAIHAQAYYTAKALDVVDHVHEAIFNAMHLQNNRLQNERQLATLFESHGVDADAFSQAFNSFGVRTQVNQAARRTGEYQVRGTPSMVVNGKYIVSTGSAVRTQQDMLAVVDYLVELERNNQ